MDPEILYADLVSGDPARIDALAERAEARSRSVDQDARAIVDAASRPLTTWYGGAARKRFETEGLEAYLSAAMTSFRLYRASEVLAAVAEYYREVKVSADDAIRFWRQRTGGPVMDPIYRAIVVGSLRRTESAYAETLRAAREALGDVQDEIEE